MAEFPSGVYSPRTKDNKPGIIYDEDDQYKVFAEDIVALDEEVVAIENELGADPSGSEDTVALRLTAIETEHSNLIQSIIDEMGANPSGPEDTVEDRLDGIDAEVATKDGEFGTKPTIERQTITSASITSGTTQRDITGCIVTLTPSKVCVAKITAQCDVHGGGSGSLYGIYCNVDGSNESSVLHYMSVNNNDRKLMTKTWYVAVNATEHIFKLRIQRNSGTGDVNCRITHTNITVELIDDDNVTLS